jgi:ATP-dependent helicase/DNAse subunit B
VVAITSPQALRARRVRALFLCDLREGAFPRPPTPEPFLGDEERRALNAASGLRLRLREDRLDTERYLLYAATSRPTELLALSWPAADDDGEPCVRSLFVDDVLDAFDPKAAGRVERRPLGAAGFEDNALAPTENERARARAAAGPGAHEPEVAPLSDPRVLGVLAARATWSASALEDYASCPVKWFVDRLLRPTVLEPDPEPMLRGVLAHRVLEVALRALSHGGPLTPERLDEARAHVRAALDEHADDARISTNPERRRAALRRLEADLLRYVEHAAHANSTFAPREFELTFGGEDDALGPAELAGGELRLQGRIDRIDVGTGGEAIVYDYKGKGAPPQAKWLEEARLQVGLYLLALPQLLDLDGVGGLYQPLGRDDDGRPRGLLRDGADPALASVSNDRVAPEEFDARLADVLGAALEAVRGIRSGALVPQPTACAWGGGCAHPSICRCEAASS